MLDPRHKDIPQIDMSVTPEGERQNMLLLNHALDGVDTFTQQFGAAVHLFDYCKMQPPSLSVSSEMIMAWSFIAARDAVMSVWHFRNSMVAANDLAKQSGYTSPKLNTVALGEAHSKFDRHFPDFAGIRHAVAHTAEMLKTQSRYEKNAFSGSYEGPDIKIENSANVVIQNALQGPVYTCTSNGKIVRCEISGATFLKLKEVARYFFAAFTQNPVA